MPRKRYRTRRTDSVDYFHAYYVYHGTGDRVLVDGGLQQKAYSFEEMTDIAGNWPNFNPVHHGKVSYEGSQKPSDIVLPESGVTLERPFWIYQLGIPPLPVPSSFKLNKFAWDAYLNAVTQVPESVSVPNFLAELGDMKDILLRWKGLLLKFLAEGVLAWDLAIKPFLSDLKKIRAAVDVARKRLKFLRDTLRKPTLIHFRATLATERVETPLQEFNFPGNFSLTDPLSVVSLSTLKLWEETQSVVATSDIVIYHELVGLDSAWALLDTLAAVTGFQNPLKVIWEGIPFSFIFDYILNLQNLLSQCQLASFSGEIQILDAGWGLKAETDRKVYGYTIVPTGKTQDDPDDHSDLPPPPISRDDNPVVIPRKVGSVKNKRYFRRRGLPLGPAVMLTEGLTSGQIRILVALILANQDDF